jgi:hypothetical protein
VKIGLLMSLFVLASCSSTMLKKVGNKSKYAPANYQEIGSVQYELSHTDWVENMRKEDAFKSMHEACNGSYEIVREGRKSEFMSVPRSQMSMQYIEFKCTEKTAQAN